ncbi:HTH-type transcriptional regulator PksA [Acrocarpospora corrugata]|uniref:HTH-type transcriptional regulator PksA n=1 Tax=Acrocarpospora corrugata TaxID=35763 RepID=A0A5M3VUN0_9ACTN|nr:TetR family transcriptional regulator C-terminal domain-containing protein [Acrocarpospora corrugata]GER98077.1 HTH-type transcriptional regulator PksA [Acrocarpospora corrugata]
MPKQVDHEQRRRQISSALWRIAARRGLESVSMREVAAEAGMSVGLVQHYFASKEEMLAYTSTHLRERLEQRVRESIAALGSPATPGQRLRAMLVALLPTDPDSRDETLVGMALFIRALNDPALATRYRHGRTQLTTAVAAQLAECGVHGDGEVAADTLLALIDGLASDLLLGHHTPAQALRVLDDHLAKTTRPAIG